MSTYQIQARDYSKIAKDIKICVITSSFNSDYSFALEKKNTDFLNIQWFASIDNYQVPGAFEIPWMLARLLKKWGYDLFLCFGVVVKWDTPHFDYVCTEVARGVMNMTLQYPTPIIFWILTCNDFDQVKARISENYAISGLNLLAEIVEKNVHH